MRKRWLAGLAGASILVCGAVILIQKVKGREQPSLALQDRGVAKAKQWRSPTDPQTKNDTLPLPLASSDPASSNPSAAGDDPVGTVETFLQRNRKEADDSIKALTQEAEMLRARLQKVEAALGRWQAIAGALNPEPKPSQVEAPPVSKAKEVLESTPPVGPPPTAPSAEIKPPELPSVPPGPAGEPTTVVPPQPLPPAVEPPPSLPGIPPPK